jgi:type II secretory ATPase GspE/PulE/Tfp pilus assembly ATPase PilB-like protein
MMDSLHPTMLDEEPDAKWLLNAAAAIYLQRIPASPVELPNVPREQWRVVANLAGVSTSALAAAVAPRFGMADVIPGQPEKSLTRLVPESLAVRHQIVPTSLDASHLVIAVSSPYCAAAIRDVAFASGRQVEARLAPPEAVESARLVLYSDAATIAHRGLTTVLNLDEEFTPISADGGDSGLVRFCRTLIRQAILRRASDIHVHAFAGGGVARLRIDGQLQRAATISNLVLVSVIRLMKAQGGMDPSNTLIPQDGQASILCDGKTYDLRISTLPSSGAEALVMRILDQSRAFSLDKTNFAPWALNTLRRLGSSASGLLLITGPTGSGKTSTLYALLGELNQPHRRIITVEDPVEYKLPGLTQVQINTRAGLTFPKALRSILRQDPDVLLIGEIRDAETAEIAIQTALTGHLVFATMHTQDAIRAITRLAELGVSAPLLADTILAVVSQRLLRQLCEFCVLKVEEPLSETERMFRDLVGALPGGRAQGCDKCNYTGFRGRFPIVEVVEMNAAMRASMDAGHTNADSLLAHVPDDWESIEQRAAAWIEAGLTTVEEAFESLGMRFWSRLAQIAGHDRSVFAHLGAAGATTRARQTTVLVISEDESRRERLVAAVGEANFGAISCVDGDAALAMIRSNRQLQHLLVDATEWNNVNGTLPADLRKVVSWSGLAVVLVHAPALSLDPAQCARANIHAAVTFPPSPQKLAEALGNASVHTNVTAPNAAGESAA